MKIFKKTVVLMAIFITLAVVVTGCGSASSTNESGVKTIKVGYSSNGYPLAYEDEDGNLTGYELEVLKLADEELKDYQFEYSAAQQDALYAGLSAGQYDLVVTNAFYTDERAEKYVLSETPFGASVVGVVSKSGNNDVKTFEDVATKKLSLAPILAGDGLYYVVSQYNKENPNNQIILNATDDANAFIESIGWVAEGRYDTTIFPRNYWEQLVKAEDGTLHDYVDQVQFSECRSVYTYPVFAKGNESLVKEISPIFKKLRDAGTLSKLSEQFYGYDAFSYANE